jgi:ATP/maltotriose-dependent transcriptional regulator MalT/DNA-binding SARP family transcriptional activator
MTERMTSGLDSAPVGESSPLIYTKARVPRASNLFSRPHLLAFLHDNIHRKLLLVSAGPGYGKTSLLVDFSHNTDLPVCWYTLDPADRDPHIFIDYLVEAIRVRFPSFGEKTRALLRRGGLKDWRAVVGLLVNEMAEDIPDYLVVVLDDYQTVDGEGSINQVMSTLLQYLPDNIHLIVAGRSIPPLSLMRLAAHGEVAGIGTEDLRFTAKEVQEILQRSLHLHLPAEEVQQLTEKCEGWITGILLAAQTDWRGGTRFPLGVHFPHGHVYRYLADEVLGQLAPDIQIFLRKVSILSQMSAAFCDALLEREDSAQVLEYLEQRNLFLVPLAGKWYRLHSLFREHLLQDARAEWDQFVQLNKRAVQLWREQGEPDEAVEHLLQAQTYDDAAQEIENLVRGAFEHNRSQTLVRWVEALPEEVRQRWPRLLLFQGKAYRAMGQAVKARSSLQQAEYLFIQGHNIEGWGQALADRAVLERMQGDYQGALRIAREALASGREFTRYAIVDLHRTIGVCLRALGDLAGAEEHCRVAVERSTDTDWYNQTLAYLDLGFCLRGQGQMEEAEEAYRQALERCQSSGSPELLANVLNNLAMGPFLRGEFAEAERLLRQALEAAQISLSPRLEAVVCASLGDLYRDRGDIPGARQSYQQGLDQARRAHDAALTTYLLEALGSLARLEGSFAEAHRYLQEAQGAAGAAASDQARIQVSLALLESAEGKDREALQRIEGAMASLESAGEQLQWLRARVAQTIVLHRARRTEEALEALREITVAAGKMAVLEPFLAEAERLHPLLDKLPAGADNSIVQKVLDYLQCRPEDWPTVGIAKSASPALRILALGPGRVFRGETPIPSRDWGGRIARELLFYIRFNAPVRKEQVGLVFWPEIDRARASSCFHAAFYRARRAVGGPFAVFQEGTYRWNPDVACWCDVEEFERLLNQVAGLPPDDPQSVPSLEQAVALYQGDFLADADNRWWATRREELRGRYLQALLQLARLYLDRREIQLAQDVYQRALQVDSFCEQGYRGLMYCFAMAEERTRAIQVYRRCRQHLSEELYAEPSAETQSLYRAIARGRELPPL